MIDRSLSLTLPKPQSVRTILSSYLQLTKPSIMLLVLVTGAVSLVMEGSLLSHPVRFLLVLLGLYLTGGCANAINQYLERDIDASMSRTKYKRPLPLQRLSAAHALGFAIVIGISGVLIFGVIFNWLTAILSLATILFYSFVYTLWLKPTTWQNIVIGGAAGAMAPVGAWTAATGGMALAPWLLFLIVFLWTPPHFWSLALFIKDDYEKVGYPMLPVVKGDKATLDQILVYIILLVFVSLTPMFAGSRWLYFAFAIVLGAVFLKKAGTARRSQSPQDVRALFRYSIIYLFGICLALAMDRLI
ncbi:MAG: protoheme IX farnesyltransferase [Candidatus Zixiibacteriota bacterium]|nr:MAG: protoheme IX farnesyltransferase [candidate division Zixibacteria bacterium]